MKADVPVFIDSVKDMGDFKMTRCTYFSIVSETPFVTEKLDYKGSRFPILAMGMEGVIIKPVGRGKYFRRKEQVEDLFRLIEDGEELYIDVNDIWVPNSLFFRKNKQRGSVFRMPVELFILAHHYRYNRLSGPEFLERSAGFTESLWFSRKETMVFRDWEQKVIGEAVRLYPKNGRLALKYKE